VRELVPISLLSGFLGSGKTTLLKELLENKGGLKVGVVVNDVAAVNIDAKLVRERSSSGIQTKSGEGVEFVELENGCACCNASDELLACIYQLVEMSRVKGYSFDRIVIEMSGVGEPKNVRREFQEAEREKHPIFEHCKLDTMLTVVDSPHFFELYSSKHDVADKVELVGPDTAGVERYDELGKVQVERKVVDLLVEQVECADMLVLNKDDRMDDKQRGVLRSIVAALNPLAAVVHCEFGKVPLDSIFGLHASVVSRDDDEDIRISVEHAKNQTIPTCTKPDCPDLSHAHGHSHAHAHSHAHIHTNDCAVPDCSDPSHTHAHEHAHAHAHEHAHTTSAAEKYGISTFVYSRRRPFHPKKLQDLIAFMPVKNAQRDKWMDHIPADNWSLHKLVDGHLHVSSKCNELSILHTIVRSKGFVWVATHPNSAFHWSQAGAHLALHPLGMWWAATSVDLWPDAGDGSSAEVCKIMQDFDTATRWGDRRQELVFIGIGMLQREIEALLDACLLTDQEMQQFEEYMQDQPNAVEVEDLSDVSPPRRTVRKPN
jgi:G3E family GTPase